MTRRPAHKTAHAVCPNGVFNWADCDTAAARQWGTCKALIDDKKASEPRECSNWAVGDDGWCGQHYASAIERIAKAARIAIARDDLKTRIDEYIEWTREHPSVHDTRLVPRVAKGRPFRLTSLA